jgi:hypothetical protein
MRRSTKNSISRRTSAERKSARPHVLVRALRKREPWGFGFSLAVIFAVYAFVRQGLPTTLSQFGRAVGVVVLAGVVLSLISAVVEGFRMTAEED